MLLYAFVPKVSKLLSLVDEIQPKQNSNYYLLHTIISLVDLAIGNEDHPSSVQVSTVRSLLTNQITVVEQMDILSNIMNTPTLTKEWAFTY